LRSRLFAKAAGALAKTDRVDCRMLAFRGESLEPDATAPPNELMESLQELTRCRPAVLAARTSLLHQLGATRARPTALEIKRQLRATETAIANLGEKNRVQIAADPLLAKRLAILTSIPGVGTVTAIALIVGLAPIACDSGQSSRGRDIKGGRVHIRNALSMAACHCRRLQPGPRTLL